MRCGRFEGEVLFDLKVIRMWMNKVIRDKERLLRKVLRNGDKV